MPILSGATFEAAGKATSSLVAISRSDTLSFTSKVSERKMNGLILIDILSLFILRGAWIFEGLNNNTWVTHGHCLFFVMVVTARLFDNVLLTRPWLLPHNSNFCEKSECFWLSSLTRNNSTLTICLHMRKWTVAAWRPESTTSSPESPRPRGPEGNRASRDFHRGLLKLLNFSSLIFWGWI